MKTKAITKSERRRRNENHLGMSLEDWTKKKRGEWNAVMRALEIFMYGAAYTPVGNDLYELQKAANRIKEAMDEHWIAI